MAALLLKLIFWFLTLTANSASFLLCHFVAILTLLVTKLFIYPSQVVEASLQRAEDLTRAVAELAGSAVWYIISNAFDLFVNLARGSMAATATSVSELVERMTKMSGQMAEILPELFEGVGEIAGNVAEDVLSNFKDAVGYVFDQAGS